MKKWLAILAMVMVAAASAAFAGDADDVARPLTQMSSKTMVNGSFSITVVPKVVDGVEGFAVTINKVDINPEGNSDPAKFIKTNWLRIGSGLASGKDGGKANKFFVDVPVVNDSASFFIPNYAKAKGMAVVEHLFAIGLNDTKTAKTGDLVLYPSDPWVAYDKTLFGNIDYNTLAIGIVMYPDGKAVPLMSLGQGKLPHGVYRAEAPKK